MTSSRRTALALTTTVVVATLVVGVFWLVHSSKHPVDTATVYAVYLAAATLAVTLLMPLGGWWAKGRGQAVAPTSMPEQIYEVADWLAEATAQTWQLEAAKRRIGTPASVRVMWRWATDELTASRAELTTPPASGTGPPSLPLPRWPGELLGRGTVTKLHKEVYTRLPLGRLLLIGAPAAGKTGAMILMLLDTLEWRAGLPGYQRDRVPVPVWLTLAGWNPPSRTLHDWVVDTMDRDYPYLRRRYGPNVTDELLRERQVALFLDGLDEMPEGIRPLALKSIDSETRRLRLRVVVTSRLEEYRGAVQTGMPDNTAVVELLPVKPSDAADYLLRDQAGPNCQQWRKIATFLTDNPRSVAAQALDNPLTLSLARDAYVGQDPTVLADANRFPTAEAVREHLIERFLITAYHDERERKRALSWLAWIADHMGTSQDLPWWDIPGWIPEWKLRLARGLAAGLSVGLAVAIAVVAFGQAHSPAAGLYMGLAAGVLAGLVAGLVARLRAKPADGPRTDVPPRNPRLTRWLLKRPVIIGVVAGFVAWDLFALVATARGANIAFSLWSGLVVGLAAGLVAGLAFGFGATLGFGLAGAPQTLVLRWPRPRELAWIIFPPMLVVVILNQWATPIADSRSSTAAGSYRADRRTSVIYGLVYGLAFGFLAALAAELTNGYGQGLEYGPVSAVGWGFIVGLAVWLTAWLVAGQVPLVKLTELILISKHQEWVRFLHLLEDAFSRQVLRQAGVLYQFRHAALQARLAAMHRQVVRPTAAPASSTADGSRSGAARLLAAGFIVSVIPFCIYVLQIFIIIIPGTSHQVWLDSAGPYWVILFASALGIAVTLGAVRLNAIPATILLWCLAWNVVYSLTLIVRYLQGYNSLIFVLGTQSAIDCVVGAVAGGALCAWMIALYSTGIRKVDPVLATFTGCFSLALLFAVIAWASGSSQAWAGVAVFSIAASLAAILTAIRMLPASPANS